jgi:hypothetical protein
MQAREHKWPDVLLMQVKEDALLRRDIKKPRPNEAGAA